MRLWPGLSPAAHASACASCDLITQFHLIILHTCRFVSVFVTALGLFLTPFDIWAARQRYINRASSLAVRQATVGVLVAISLFEDLPQLVLGACPRPRMLFGCRHRSPASRRTACRVVCPASPSARCGGWLTNRALLFARAHSHNLHADDV